MIGLYNILAVLQGRLQRVNCFCFLPSNPWLNSRCEHQSHRPSQHQLRAAELVGQTAAQHNEIIFAYPTLNESVFEDTEGAFGNTTHAVRR